MNYAYDARSAQKRKSVRNSCVIHAFRLCDRAFKCAADAELDALKLALVLSQRSALVAVAARSVYSVVVNHLF